MRFEAMPSIPINENNVDKNNENKENEQEKN